MFALSIHSRFAVLIFVVSLHLVSTHSVAGQDMAQLAMRARVNLYENWHFDSVAYYCERIIGKKYTPAFAYSDYGWYLMLADRFDEGLSYIQRAAEMDPADKQLATWNAWALLWSGDLPNARRWTRKALSIDPNYGEALHVSSRIASARGEHQEAINLAGRAAARDPSWRALVPIVLANAGKREAAIARAQQIAKDENVFDALLLAEVYTILKNDDEALLHLQKAYEMRHPFMPWLEIAPGTERLHDDPRFMAIVRNMNLPK